MLEIFYTTDGERSSSTSITVTVAPTGSSEVKVSANTDANASGSHSHSDESAFVTSTNGLTYTIPSHSCEKSGVNITIVVLSESNDTVSNHSNNGWRLLPTASTRAMPIIEPQYVHNSVDAMECCLFRVDIPVELRNMVTQ